MEDAVVHVVGLDSVDLERVENDLEDSHVSFSVTATEDVESALAAFGTAPVDCVVCPPEIGGTDVLAFRSLVRDRGIVAPFVLFDGERSALLDGPPPVDGPAFAGGPSPDDAEESADAVSSLVERIEVAVGSRTGPDADPIGSLGVDPERLRPFLDGLADPVFVVDEEGRFALVNDALLEYATFDRDEIEGSPVAEVVKAGRFDAPLSKLASLRSGELSQTTLELSFEGDEGEERVAEANVRVQTDADGDYTGSVGILRDVTERIERERELALYESILETTPIGIFAVDEDGTIVWCNEAYPKPFHFTRDDLEGAPFSRIVEAGYYSTENLDNYTDRIRRLLSSENDVDRLQYEDTIVDVDGNTRIFEVTMRLLPLEDGEFSGTVQAFREVTEERRYRHELERQNERLEKFASFVSHDLRNPLNVAQGYLDLIASDVDDEHVEELAWSLDRMEELIGNLLTLAREGKAIGDPEPVSLEAIARESWGAVDTKGATLEIDGGVTIAADPDRLRSLFENCFRNSLEHGVDGDTDGSGGESDDQPLTVTVGPLDDTSLADRDAAKPGAPTGFYVADDGVGLPTDDGGRVDRDLFEVGYTTNESGTGFGTGIVKEIVDAHGWTITAGESEDGGALFEIRGVGRAGSARDLAAGDP